MAALPTEITTETSAPSNPTDFRVFRSHYAGSSRCSLGAPKREHLKRGGWYCQRRKPSYLERHFFSEICLIFRNSYLHFLTEPHPIRQPHTPIYCVRFQSNLIIRNRPPVSLLYRPLLERPLSLVHAPVFDPGLPPPLYLAVAAITEDADH